jgi:hypothetical protein
MAEWKTTFYPATIISNNDTRIPLPTDVVCKVFFLVVNKTKIDNAQFINILDTVAVDIVTDTDFHISGH